MWARAVAPFAAWITRALWSSLAKLVRETAPPTRLTERIKREVNGAPTCPGRIVFPHSGQRFSRGGAFMGFESTRYAACAVDDATNKAFGNSVRSIHAIDLWLISATAAARSA